MVFFLSVCRIMQYFMLNITIDCIVFPQNIDTYNARNKKSRNNWIGMHRDGNLAYNIIQTISNVLYP